MEKHAGKIILSPRITEKGAYLSDQGAYVFNVVLGANKFEVKAAVEELYKVTPRMVRMVTIPRKQVRSRKTNRIGQSRGGKKAYVYLKKGETLEIA